ncbi:mechanosensitive ion channel family protein [Mucilaginibacter pocheonensis]|uniref:Small-conductance mechanosensitive channel n=1 Tax=Mucilaginibacter pocheonensis TaxID=398050 RepID=A0ABU1T7Z5_9SPHI|nr:mechanosensitive ion channel domain-containing protein [Mucilaginibacter pocheonensis]MDR6941507.1 small-conductance mechanosensitive channel [Mucilaginibacter pocheonensis]
MYKIVKVAAFSFLLITFFSCADVLAQTKKKKARSVRDSLRASILSRDSMMRSLKRSDTSTNNLLQKVEYYTSAFNQIKTNLSKQIDTVDISEQLPRYEKRISLIKSLIDNDKSSTLRYLYAIRDILTRSDDQLDLWQEQLADINSKLVQNQTDLNAISQDSVLKILPADSSLATTFLIQKIAIDSKYHRLDTVNKKLMVKIGLLQNRTSSVYISILDLKDQIDLKIRNFSIRALSAEYSNIWNMKADEGTDFTEALSKTATMNSKLFNFFIGRDILIHLSGLLILLGFVAWVYASRKKIRKTNEAFDMVFSQANYVIRYPFVSAVIIAFTLIPNFYDHPPVVVLETFFVILITALLYLTRKTCPKPLFNYLLLLFIITNIYCLSNLFIQVTNADRVAVLLLGLASIFISLRFLPSVRKAPDDFLPYTGVVLKFFILLQTVSFICNVFGRFSLAKIIGVTAVHNLWLAMAMYYIVQMVMEALFLQLEASKNSNNLTSYIDFQLLKNKFRSVLVILTSLLWLVMLTQNLSIEDVVFTHIETFLTTNRSIGGTNTQFTFQSVIIFIAVIWLSSILSKVISYLYDVSAKHKHDMDMLKKKNRTSTLLIRIGVIAIGFFLAVAASGVPIDKITIIISAFGIGIGFGLQNIVNNLVSGLILAFEKPIQVGDIIEVDSRSGTILDIGIRASKIATSDGAEVIIPNGDLISHHVINWTLSNNNRRVELIIGVAYGTSIEKVKGLLNDVLKSHTDIMTTPEPSVLLHNLSESSVDFRVLFWAADINTWLGLKSSVLTDIYDTFNKEGIEIPFPQQDVHVLLPPDGVTVNSTNEKVKPAKNIKGTNANDTKADQSDQDQ